jgi:hypothetical protein
MQRRGLNGRGARREGSPGERKRLDEGGGKIEKITCWQLFLGKVLTSNGIS